MKRAPSRGPHAARRHDARGSMRARWGSIAGSSVSALARPQDRQPRWRAARAAAGHDQRLRRWRDGSASGPDDVRARVLRSRGALSIHAARPARHRLRDHLARERVRCRRQGLRSRESSRGSGMSRRSPTNRSSSAIRRAWIRAFTSRVRCRRWKISRGGSWNGTSRRCVAKRCSHEGKSRNEEREVSRRRFEGSRRRGLGHPRDGGRHGLQRAERTGARHDTPPEQKGALTEVIVTATRRAERLQDVPESITAFDYDADRHARPAADGRLRAARAGPFDQRARARRHDHRVPRRGELRPAVRRGLLFGRCISTSSPSRRAAAIPTRDSSTSSVSKRCAARRARCTAQARSPARCASSRTSPIRRGFDAWADAQLTSTSDGGTGHDVSAMVNVPLVADKLALRLVGFTAEDAGFIDNVLGDSAGRHLRQRRCRRRGRQHDQDERRPRGASLGSHRQRQRHARRHVPGRERRTATATSISTSAISNQVRFEKESLDDKWYQLGADAECRDADRRCGASPRPISTATSATRPTPRTMSSRSTRTPSTTTSPVYDFGGDPRGFATNHEETEITTFEARLSSQGRFRQPLGLARRRVLQQGEGPHRVRQLRPRLRRHAVVRVLQCLRERYSTGNDRSRPTDTWFLGSLRHRARPDRGVRRAELRRHGALHRSPPAAAGSTTTASSRRHQEQPAGLHRLLAPRWQPEDEGGRHGLEAELSPTSSIATGMVYATYSEGFRVGGSNPLKPASALPRDYKSDTLKNYEVGVKTEWLDRRVRFNLSAYHMEWDDFAVQVEDPQPAVFQLGFVNLPTAEITGHRVGARRHVSTSSGRSTAPCLERREDRRGLDTLRRRTRTATSSSSP